MPSLFTDSVISVSFGGHLLDIMFQDAPVLPQVNATLSQDAIIPLAEREKLQTYLINKSPTNVSEPATEEVAPVTSVQTAPSIIDIAHTLAENSTISSQVYMISN